MSEYCPFDIVMSSQTRQVHFQRYGFLHIGTVLPIALEIGGQATGDLPRKVFPERSRHRWLKYFAEKLQQPEFQAKITGIKEQCNNV
jgi:hypothetical protein